MRCGPLPPAEQAPLPAAAPSAVATIVAGPERPASILFRSARALYLQVEHGPVIAVLTRDALRLPCGLILGTTSRQTPLDSAGGPATVGGGRVRVGGLVAEVVRHLADSRPRSPVTVAAPALEQLRERLAAHGWSEHPRALLDELAQGCANDRVVRSLVGAGTGLTPSGDDVLAGHLVMCVALGVLSVPNDPSSPVGALATAVRRAARTRTTALSRTLLDHACLGESVPEITRLIRALARPSVVDDRGLDVTIEAVLAIGHTSGVALATGVRTACDAWAAPTARAGRELVLDTFRESS